MPPNDLSTRVAGLNDWYRLHAATEVLRHALTAPDAGRLALVSSFGAESVVLLHMVSVIHRDTPVIFLDTELGNYERTTHPEFKLNEGEEYNFYCPVCHFKLNKEDKPNLVMLHMTDNDGKECEINISNIIGEQFTFQIKDKEVRAYGPHAELYKKYLDVPEEDRKYL